MKGSRTKRQPSGVVAHLTLGQKDNMDPIEVAESYDRIADRWNGPQLNRKRGMRQHERALSFTTRTGAALDVGCGSSGRIVAYLSLVDSKLRDWTCLRKCCVSPDCGTPTCVFTTPTFVRGYCQEGTTLFPPLTVFGTFRSRSIGTC